MQLTNMDTTHPHKISTYALERSDQLFFLTMLEMAQKSLDFYWIFNDLSPHIIVVDVDQPEGKTFWQAHHTNKNLVALARFNNLKANWFLEKPLRVRHLIDLLKHLSVEHPNLFDENVSVTTNQGPDEIDEMLASAVLPQEIFDPSLYLTGLLINAQQSGQPQCLRGCFGKK